MKVLYIGHYREFGGWSQAAVDQILALDKAGVDVVCRNITLTKDRSGIHPKIEEFEKKSSANCDICIQHVLPHHLVGSSKFKKNIAFFEGESLSIKHLPWFCYLQLMDEVWVSNKHLLQSLVNDNINIPVKLVHHAVNVDKYKRQYNKLNIPLINNTFKFYYIGDLNDRKNIRSVSRCFHSEFDVSENVSLIIKVNKFGKSPEEIQTILNQQLAEEKQGLRIYDSMNKYKKEVVITTELKEQNLYELYNYGDCFILPSHGEAWSIPSLDAMGFGSTPICSNFGGPSEFIDKDNKYTGSLIDGVFSCCKCSDAAFPELFTGKEYWFQPCEKQARKAMRYYYESYLANPISHKQKAIQAGIVAAEKFSYKNIGNQMLEVLNES